MSQGQANTSFSITSSSKVSNIFAGDFTAADEGSFFTTVQAPTASTAVATTTVVLGQANPVFAINNQQAAGGYNLYLRYIKLLLTAVGSGNASLNYVATVDTLQAKLTTATTPLPVSNVNLSSSTVSRGIPYGGVLVAAATSAGGRIVGQGQVTGALQVAQDEYLFLFGQPVYGGDLIGTQTLVKRLSIPMAPIIIGPQQWFTLGFWAASTAAAANTIGIECGWIERPAGQ